MTSSFAHAPHSSAPYSQHYKARNPGFGEIGLRANNNALYPSLVNYVDSKIIRETSLLQRQSTITSTSFAAGEITIDAVLGGLVNVSAASTAPAVAWTIEETKAAFKERFGRDPNVGDGCYFTTNNSTVGSITYKALSGPDAVIPTNSSWTLGIYFLSDTTYTFIVVSKFGPLP